MTRDYLFDNCKVFLIFLVVAGHFVGPGASDNTFLLLLKWVIVSFHMPAFIFISGYFSKKEMPLLVTVKKLALPYLIYEVIYYLWYVLVLHKSTQLALLKPKFTLWYLMALFFWRVITPYVKKLPFHFVLALFAGILIGFSGMEDNFLTIPRALVFYPFYLAGTYLDRERITRLRTQKMKILAAVIVSAISLILCLMGWKRITTMLIFYGRYSYETMHQTMITGVLWRIFMYVIGFLMTYALLILMTEKKLSISYIGTRTMAIYLFHGLTFKFLESCTGVLKNIDTVLETVLLLGGCVFLTWFFSLKPFTWFTNLCSANVPAFHRNDHANS